MFVFVCMGVIVGSDLVMRMSVLVRMVATMAVFVFVVLIVLVTMLVVAVFVFMTVIVMFVVVTTTFDGVQWIVVVLFGLKYCFPIHKYLH